MRKYLNVLLLSALIFVTSCVGTVQETATSITDISSNYTPIITFAGIHTATAISDTRVELFFYPAGGGSGKYIYDIYVGNNPTPISIPSDVLTPDYRGQLKYTVNQLSRLQTYLFSIQVRDQNTAGISTNQVIKPATTFENRVANFIGISSASNMPGQDGKDSIMVRYPPAVDEDIIIDEKWDPMTYELVLVDSDRLTPQDMDLDYNQDQGRWVFQWSHDKFNTVNQYIARGLLPKRKYYARIRLLHNDSEEDVYNPHKRSELNTNYVEISTLSDELSSIDFNEGSFLANILPGSLGLNTVQAKWDPAQGVFDHYRLLYSKKGAGIKEGIFPDLCLSEILVNDPEGIFCKKLSYLATSTQITGLIPYTEYEFRLLICQTDECRPGQFTRDIKTDPATIFNGITQVIPSTRIEDSQKLTITYDDPSVIGGYFDGLILKMRRSTDESAVEVEVTELSSPESHRPYAPLSSTEITVEGIDYLSSLPYCFRLYPYKWNAEGTERTEIENQNWKCIIPKIEPPKVEDFNGIESATTLQEYVSINWLTPTAGFYTDYVVFWTSGLIIDWTAAKAAFEGADNGYNFQIVSGDVNNYTLQGLPTGNYVFGILTLHRYVSETSTVKKWSETNTRFMKCNVDNTSTTWVDCNL